MATPVGHSLFGLIIGRSTERQTQDVSWRWYLLAMISANAPDLDFIPGILLGDVNSWHHGPSHSVTVGVLFGLLVSTAAGWFKVSHMRVGLMATAAYLSHLLLDWLCVDSRAPFGIPILWPFLDSYYISPHTILSGVQHGVPGDSFAVFLSNVFSWDNVKTFLFEILVLVPLMFIVWALGRFKKSAYSA